MFRRGGDSSERNLSQNKVTNFFNVVKEKIHKDKEREIDSGLQISRAQSTGTISSVLSHSSTHDSSQTSNVRSVLLPLFSISIQFVFMEQSVDINHL
jgi:hypothetical protein